MFKKVGIIGTGNMGSAVAKAVYAKKLPLQLYLSNRTVKKAEALAEELPGAVVSSDDVVASECDIVFLAVKPVDCQNVLLSLKDTICSRSDSLILCSMVNGIGCDQLAGYCGNNTKIIRIMPNTPVAIGEGVIPYCGKNVSDAEFADFSELLSKAGMLDKIQESYIDAASALSGCGPAFTYLYIEALADGAVACGLSREKALKYAAQMVSGSAKMVLESGKHPGELKDAVCSPGGTTIEGIKSLEEHGFRSAAMDAVTAAYEKTLKVKG